MEYYVVFRPDSSSFYRGLFSSVESSEEQNELLVRGGGKTSLEDLLVRGSVGLLRYQG